MDKNLIPLIVDLDHTLIDTDLLFLSSLGVLSKRPWLIFHYLFWLWKGKGFLKDQLVRRFEINISELPYNEDVIGFIMQRKKQGSPLLKLPPSMCSVRWRSTQQVHRRPQRIQIWN